MENRQYWYHELDARGSFSCLVWIVEGLSLKDIYRWRNAFDTTEADCQKVYLFIQLEELLVNREIWHKNYLMDWLEVEKVKRQYIDTLTGKLWLLGVYLKTDSENDYSIQ